MLWLPSQHSHNVQSQFQVAIAPNAFISARKSWYFVSVSAGTAGRGAVCGIRAGILVGIKPNPEIAEAPVRPDRGRASAALAACSLRTRTEAGTIAVTVLSSLARGILTTVDAPVKVDLVSLLSCPTPADSAVGGGPAQTEKSAAL